MVGVPSNYRKSNFERGVLSNYRKSNFERGVPENCRKSNFAWGGGRPRGLPKKAISRGMVGVPEDYRKKQFRMGRPIELPKKQFRARQTHSLLQKNCFEWGMRHIIKRQSLAISIDVPRLFSSFNMSFGVEESVISKSTSLKSHIL